MKKNVQLLLMALLTGCIAVVLFFFHDDSESSASPVALTAARIPVTPPASAVNADETMPQTTGSSGFVVDATGHLKVNADTRRLIAGLLGPVDQSPGAADIARAQAAINAQLKEPAADEAVQLLNNFVAYRKAAQDLATKKSTGPTPGDDGMASIVDMQQQSALRNKYLGTTTSQAMFGDEEAIERYRLARQQIMQMNGLSTEQKDEQVALLYQQLPESAQSTLKNTEWASAAQ